jgi:FG-GAP-like repeat
VTRDTAGNLAVLYGKGDGTFLPRQALPFTLSATTALTTSFPHTDLVDLNGDGRLDLVSSDGKTLAVLLNTR